MTRTSITIVVVVLLCAAGMAYSQGWFGWASSDYEMESEKVGADQAIDKEKAEGDSVKLTQRMKEPVAPLLEGETK